MAVITIKDLTYYYPETETPALDHLQLEVQEGEFVLLVGGSGSGKSTLIRAIAGLIPDFYGGRYGGEVCLDGQNIRQMERRHVVQKVGVVFQDPESQLVMTSAEQELAFGLENIGLDNALIKRRIMEVGSALSLTHTFKKSIPELSGGQKQKVALASVLVMQPEILLLDEPTSQLDPVAGEEIITLVKRLNEENGVTVILVEQRLERCFHLADRVLVMDRGKIIYEHRHLQEVARWAVKNKTPFIPPLAKLFAGIDYPQVPLTVKEGRKLLKEKLSYRQVPEQDFRGLSRQCEKDTAAHKPLDVAVNIENLWFTYSGGIEALKQVDLKIESGDFVAVMGENGAGKTTLLKMINGLLKPGKGKVQIFGQDTKKVRVEELAETVGYLSQNPNDYLFLPTVREELAFTLNNLGMSDDGQSDRVLEQLSLAQVAEANPRDLSTGERQRVALATLLVAKPKLLLLDEPTRGLDYQLKQQLGEILQGLQQQGLTILLVTHDVEFAAEYAQKVVLMSQGTVIGMGDKTEMLTRSTFYSPQVSKLFYHINDEIVTLAQGREVLRSLMGKI